MRNRTGRSIRSAADRAKYLLHNASQRLNTVSPLEDLSGDIEDSMPYPAGDSVYQGRKILEPGFSEISPNNLSFFLETGGPNASGQDRLETSMGAMRRLVGRHFGKEALHWLDGRSEPFRNARGLSWGARFGSAFDTGGMRESQIVVEWGNDVMDSLPGGLYRIAQAASEIIPQLSPAFTTIHCGRTAGNQQITFDLDAPLPLANLAALMDRLGLGKHHASMMSVTAFALGARFTLPPESATLTFRITRNGVEMRLDVLLDAIPDAPSQLMSLLRLQMTERPVSLRALDRWLIALTPDNIGHPGRPSTLSVTVRKDMPPRLSLHLIPSVLQVNGDQRENIPSNSGTSNPTRNNSPSTQSWMPSHA